MAKRTVRWRGNKILRTMADASDKALYAGGRVVLAEAQRRVPVRSGRLHASGYVTSTVASSYRRRKGWKREKKARPGVIVVHFAAPHSHLIENGTKRIRKRPFLRPALHAMADEVVEAVARVMGRVLDRDSG